MAVKRAIPEGELSAPDQQRLRRLATLLQRPPNLVDIRPVLDSHLELWEKCSTKTPAAVELGRRGGRANKGRDGIVKGLSMVDAERRREIALKGVAARLSNKAKNKP